MSPIDPAAATRVEDHTPPPHSAGSDMQHTPARPALQSRASPRRLALYRKWNKTAGHQKCCILLQSVAFPPSQFAEFFPSGSFFSLRSLGPLIRHNARRFWQEQVGRVAQARLRYALLSTLMRTISPISMNGGTRVLRPVSRVASFCWLVAVAPLMPGGVSVTFRSTVLGIS
jgi:hypothetical protein